MKIAHAILAILLTTSVVGCSTVDKIEVLDLPIEKTPLNLSDPDPVSLETVEWRVVSEKSSTLVFERMSDKGIDPVLIGLTDNDYKSLSINIQRLKNYIVELKFILHEYRNYYEGNIDGSKTNRSKQ